MPKYLSADEVQKVEWTLKNLVEGESPSDAPECFLRDLYFAWRSKERVRGSNSHSFRNLNRWCESVGGFKIPSLQFKLQGKLGFREEELAALLTTFFLRWEKGTGKASYFNGSSASVLKKFAALLAEHLTSVEDRAFINGLEVRHKATVTPYHMRATSDDALREALNILRAMAFGKEVEVAVVDDAASLCGTLCFVPEALFISPRGGVIIVSGESVGSDTVVAREVSVSIYL